MKLRIEREDWLIAGLIPLFAFQTYVMLAEFLRLCQTREFWVLWAIAIPAVVAVVVACVAIRFAYIKLCDWFDGALAGARSRSEQRSLASSGVTFWLGTNPLHDRELDG